MQPRITVDILVLQAEGFVCASLYTRSSFLEDPSRYSCRTIRGCRPYRSSLSGYRFGRSESSGFIVGFHRLRLSNCRPVRRVRSCRIVSVGNGFGQPSGVVAVAGSVTGGVGDIDGDLVEVV